MGPIKRGKGMLFKMDPTVHLPSLRSNFGGPEIQTPPVLTGTVDSMTQCKFISAVSSEICKYF